MFATPPNLTRANRLRWEAFRLEAQSTSLRQAGDFFAAARALRRAGLLHRHASAALLSA